MILGAALHLLNNLFISKGLPSCARMGSGAMISWTYICSILVLCIAKNLISVIQEIEHKVFLAISLTLLPISTFIPSSRIVKQTYHHFMSSQYYFYSISKTHRCIIDLHIICYR